MVETTIDSVVVIGLPLIVTVVFIGMAVLTVTVGRSGARLSN